ncbi:MAG: DUF167 domain-containing protein [archaeon]
MMDGTLDDILNKKTVSVIIRPNAIKSSIDGYDEARGALKVSVKAPPEKGKANAELIRFLKKESGKDISIISGFTSRKKLIKIP